MVKLLIISILALTFASYATSSGAVLTPEDVAYTDTIAPQKPQNELLKLYKDKITDAANPDTAKKYADILIDTAKHRKDTILLIDTYQLLANTHYYNCKYDDAIALNNLAYDLAQKIHDTILMASAMDYLATNYYMNNEIQKSLDNYQSALLLYKGVKEKQYAKISQIYRNLAIISSNTLLFATAEENICNAMEIDRNINDSLKIASDILALVNIKNNQYDIQAPTIDELHSLERLLDSVPFYMKASEKRLNTLQDIITYNLIKADINQKLFRIDGQSWRIDSAYRHIDMALQDAKSTHDYDNITAALLVKADIAYAAKDYGTALNITDHLKQHINDEMWEGNKMDIYRIASMVNAALKNYEDAYLNRVEYDNCRNKYFNDNIIKQNAEFNVNIRIQEMQTEQANVNKRNTDTIEKQHRINILTIAIIVIGSIALLWIIRAFLSKRTLATSLNDKNQQLSRQQEEIIAQRNTIEEQRQASERSNLIMYQSIRYARHIQNAALPSEDHIRRIFPDHFVYYEPKDIVSGDFYYATQNAGLDIFVLADCTGHGVPGGFLSMLGISIIKELLRNPEIDIMPGIILDMMREYVKQALANDEEVAEAIAMGEESFSTADGMDMSIVAYDKYNHLIRFAGAYQNLYIARNGEITRIKGDRMPVGRHINESASFQTQFFETQKDDMVYMSSDGIPSQIGFSGVKFMSKRLIDFFKSNYMLPCETQKRNITNIMNDWLFGAIQIDDLSLVGIRITE